MNHLKYLATTMPAEMRAAWEQNNPGVGLHESWKRCRLWMRTLFLSLFAFCLAYISLAHLFLQGTGEEYMWAVSAFSVFPLGVFLYIGFVMPQNDYSSRLGKCDKAVDRLCIGLVSLLEQGGDMKSIRSAQDLKLTEFAVAVLDAHANLDYFRAKGAKKDLKIAIAADDKAEELHSLTLATAAEFGLSDGKSRSSFDAAKAHIGRRT